jgi:DnaJ-class molecular chaperone
MDHYQTLGVTKSATPDEIKKSYRKLASKHHPDKGGDTSTFQKIEEAYRILSDPQQRQQYDNPMPQGNPFGQGFNFNGGPDIFQDFMSQMFRQQHQQQQRQKQRPSFRSSVAVTLEQVYNGEDYVIRLQTPTNTHAATIQIQKGIHNGDQVKFDNIIQDANLIVEFRVMPHLKYDRNGNDLLSNHPISVLDLITGTAFEFTTISGKTFEVTVKPKTQPFMQLKIAGQGMPIQGTNQYGDQIILLKPYIPDIIDESIIDSILQSKNKESK